MATDPGRVARHPAPVVAPPHPPDRTVPLEERMRTAPNHGVLTVPAGGDARRLHYPVFLLLLSLAPAVHAAPAPRDTVWTCQDLASRPIREIASLPVVNVVDDARAPAFVEDRIGPHFCQRTRQSWLMPDAARRKLERQTRRPYSQLDSLARQIWIAVRVDSLTARDVARQLQVQSVLCIRIDRWERLEVWAPRRTRAFVAMRAALVDSGGAVLWTVSGENSAPTSLRFQTELAENESPSWFKDWGVPLATADRRRAPDFDKAVSELLARWVKRFPVRRS
jgi:hypothetical protein